MSCRECLECCCNCCPYNFCNCCSCRRNLLECCSSSSSDECDSSDSEDECNPYDNLNSCIKECFYDNGYGLCEYLDFIGHGHTGHTGHTGHHNQCTGPIDIEVLNPGETKSFLYNNGILIPLDCEPTECCTGYTGSCYDNCYIGCTGGTGHTGHTGSNCCNNTIYCNCVQKVRHLTKTISKLIEHPSFRRCCLRLLFCQLIHVLTCFDPGDQMQLLNYGITLQQAATCHNLNDFCSTLKNTKTLLCNIRKRQNICCESRKCRHKKRRHCKPIKKHCIYPKSKPDLELLKILLSGCLDIDVCCMCNDKCCMCCR